MIRCAGPIDVPRMVDMGMRFVAESSYRDFIEPDAVAIGAMMRRLIAGKASAIFVIENDKRLTGMMGVFAYLHPMSAQPVGVEAFWWVEPEARGRDGVELFNRAEAWLKTAGVKKIQMVAPNDKVARFYRSRGYQKLEEQYQRDI